MFHHHGCCQWAIGVEAVTKKHRAELSSDVIMPASLLDWYGHYMLVCCNIVCEHLSLH